MARACSVQPAFMYHVCNNFCNLNLFYFFSYRILGLCNNFAYVIMLSAAHDILKDQEQKDHVESHNVIIYNNRKLLIENFNDQWMTFEMMKWWHLVVGLLKIGQEKKLTKLPVDKWKLNCSHKFENYQINSIQWILIMVHVQHVYIVIYMASSIHTPLPNITCTLIL